jgi:CRP/FNR family transcriptional regulator
MIPPTLRSSLDKILALQRTPLFASLPAEEVLTVANLCTTQTLDTGDELFHQGDLGEALYIVVYGAVRIERNHKEIAVLGPGECVGEVAAMDWEPHSASAIAAEPTLLLQIDRHNLLDLIADDPGLTRNLARVLVARMAAKA